MRTTTIIAIAVAICLTVGAAAFLTLTAESDQAQPGPGGSGTDANLAGESTDVPEVASGLTASDPVATNVPVASDSASYATLCGMITDKNLDGFPGATVTLWETQYDSATGQYVNVRPAAINNNPQIGNTDRDASALGTYEFHVESPGTYNVTAEMDGYLWSALTTIDSPGLHTLNVNSRVYDYPGNY